MNQEGSYRITKFQKLHAYKLALFQVITAKQLENLDMNIQLVIKAVQFLQSHPQFGFFLVKLKNQVTIGSLLLTFENSESWWIQSVYVEKEYRRQGHFKQLFYQSCKIAQQNRIKKLKLYANDQNLRAISAYKTLGMNMTDKKFYAFDFVYGQIKIEDIMNRNVHQKMTIKSLENKDSVNLSEFEDLLHQKETSKNNPVGVFWQQKLMAVVFYYTEFSEWRFALTYYIDSFLIHKELKKYKIAEIHNSLCCYFSDLKQLKLGALRYILNTQSLNFPQILQNGQLQHNCVMEMNL